MCLQISKYSQKGTPILWKSIQKTTHSKSSKIPNANVGEMQIIQNGLNLFKDPDITENDICLKHNRRSTPF